MTSHFNAVVMTSLVVVQLVVGQCLVTVSQTEGPAAAPGVLCPLPWSPRLATVKRRRPVVGRIQRLWLSRGSTSALMNDQLRQLLDSTVGVDLLSEEDIDQAVDGSRSMRYGR